MSQRNRIFTASIALVAALALAAPPSAHATGLRAPRLPAIPAWSHIWSWLVDLLPAGIAPKPAERLEKEGSMINPDGHSGTSTAPSTAPSGLTGPDGGW